ncbi:hypothetical protein NE237_028622 [Protea cynaroides]|uniref:Uncharacterized protein n=1 Tax=Protea cynaroides TaxID=273540 RepID=A0A9Q0GSR7_9MAGN|nr:hypothetical protein NE237_028622 [Protea cynaroides]
MRFDRFGQGEPLECNRNPIIKEASIPARDLRILGPVSSQSSNILGVLFGRLCLVWFGLCFFGFVVASQVISNLIVGISKFLANYRHFSAQEELSDASTAPKWEDRW